MMKVNNPTTKTENHIPTRTCVACRRKADKATLLRIVLADGRGTIDYAQKINSRAIYICKGVKCLNKATKNKNNNKYFTSEVVQELVSILEKECHE